MTNPPISPDAYNALIDLGRASLTRSREFEPKDITADRTVWMFWGGSLPEHLAACIGRAEQLSGNCKVVVLEPDTVRVFLPDLPASWDTLPSWAHKSDVVAAYLLDRFGGLYIDVDTVAVTPIDSVIQEFLDGDEEYVAFLNGLGLPSVGVMWSRRGSEVAARYKRQLEAILRGGFDELDWVALGTPLLTKAFEDSGHNIEKLESMLGRVALFYWPGWRTFTSPFPVLRPFLNQSPANGSCLMFVALFHSRSGAGIAARQTPTIFDALLGWSRPPALSQVEKETSVTVVVKTFNRPRTIAYSLERLRARLPDASVIVVDDSADEYIADLSKFEVSHLLLDFDSGLSRGRNIGISHVQSEFFLLHDDDQFPAGDFDLASVVDTLQTLPVIDAAGGREDDTPPVFDSFEMTDERILVQYRETAWSSVGKGADAVKLFHMVQNQTLWRTQNFRRKKLSWTPELKVGEHVDFFYRYRGLINVIYSPALHFGNVPREVCSSDEVLTNYSVYRNRQREMWKLFKTKNNILKLDLREPGRSRCINLKLVRNPVRRFQSWVRRGFWRQRSRGHG